MISTVLNKKNKKEKLPQHFLCDEIKYFGKDERGEKVLKSIEIKLTDEKTIADQFNVFFGQIGTKLADGIIYEGNKNMHSYLTKKPK